MDGKQSFWQQMENVDENEIRAQITEIRIGYRHSRDFGRTIHLKNDELWYKNTISPTIGYMVFPQKFLCEKVRRLTKQELEEIFCAVESLQLLALKASEEASVMCPGASYSSLEIKYGSGEKFRYLTRFEPGDAFKEFVKLLSRYCAFENLSESDGIG